MDNAPSIPDAPRPLHVVSDAQALRAHAHTAVAAYRSSQSLDQIDQAITDALWSTNEAKPQLGQLHEQQILWALGWFAAALHTVSGEEAQSIARRLHVIEQIAAQLSDVAGRKAEGRA